MRRMLISAAAMVFLAAPALISSAWAQPDHPDHGDRAQARQPAPPQQGGGHEHGGGNRAMPAPAAAAPQAASHNGQGHRGGPQMAAPGPQAAPQAAPQGRGDRGMAHTNTLPPGRTPPAGTPAQAAAQARRNGPGNRSNLQAGQNNGRDINRSDNRPNNFQGSNRGNGNPGTAGQRRDFSSFREFHRDFNASRRFRAPVYRRPQGWYDHRWSFGEYLPRTYWVRNYWLDDFAVYGLPPPPYGAVWVRVGSDALLVDEDSGEVITVEYSVFY